MDLSQLQFEFSSSSPLPKYQQLAFHLERMLFSGSFVVGDRLPGDRELASHLSTSTVTVNKALGVLVERGLLRRRVGDGTFVEDPSSPVFRRIGIICHEVIMPDLAYITPLLHNFHRYWEERDYQVLTLRGKPAQYRHLFEEFNLAGMMILVPREEFFADIEALYNSGLPVVSIGFANPKLPLISFGSNHEKTAEKAVNYLYEQGHKRIGYIALTESGSNLINIRGYKKTMWKHALPIHPDWEIGSEYEENLAKHLKKIFSRKEPPTALLVLEIHLIIRIYNILQQINVKVPEDLSIIGFDDPPYLTQINPPLTVFKQQLEEFSGQAAKQLENQIMGKKLEEINHQNIDSILSERKSCKKIQKVSS